MRKTAIFDLDGTLLDTLEDLFRSTNYALQTQGLPVRTKEEVRGFVGNGIRNLLLRAVPDGAENPAFESCFAAFHAHYKEHCQDTTKPYPGVTELLRRLAKEGFRLAVVSNKADYAVRELTEQFFGGLVDFAVGEKESVRRKPAPDTVFEVMRVLGAAPPDTVYIGDSDVDIATAENAGIPCISVLWGFREKDFLKARGAACFAGNAQELYTMLTAKEASPC